ncbi:MAG: hypothetical protein ABL925_20125 [Methylococcales bacterium]
MRKIYRWLIIGLCLLLNTPLSADDNIKGVIAVVYPTELNPAKSKIVAEVVKGIQTVLPNLTVIAYDSDHPDLQARLDKIHPNRVIALSKQATTATQGTSYRDRLICGLYYFQANACPGVSLALDGNELLRTIAEILPKTKRLFLVYESSLAGVAVPKPDLRSSIDLENMPAEDTIGAINLLGNLIESTAHPVEDVVAIPPNLPEDIMFKVLASAWDKHITLISTNLGHLEYGVFMANVPDPYGMGRQLGKLSLQPTLSWQAALTSKPALNRLVARHLGFDFPVSGKDPFFLRIK